MHRLLFILSAFLALSSPLFQASALSTDSVGAFVGRSLKQTEACEWQPETEQCVISDAAKETLLGDSSSPYARLLLRFIECRIQGPDQRTCVAVGCGWAPDEGGCVFVNYVDEYATSPCVEPVPRTLEYNALFRQCSALNSTECSDLGCSWHASSEICYADTYKIDFGIDSLAFSTDRSTVDYAKAAELSAAFGSEFSFDSLDPDWEVALDWDVPETECPEGSDPLVCEYVDAYLAIVAPVLFYCSSKYDSPVHVSRCTADEYCDYSTDQGRCIHNYSVTKQSLEKADEVLLELVSESGDREIVKTTLRCLRSRNEDECLDTENCAWDRFNEACVTDGLFINAQIVSQAEEDPNDPVCLQYGLPLAYDCTNRTTIATCQSNENCGWDLSTQQCAIGQQAILNLIAEEDETLAELLAAQNEACGIHQTQSQCITA